MRSSLLLLPACLLLAACGDDAKRPLGASCITHEECASGVCGGGVCLDPDGDEDVDGLINRVEASLATNPVVADSDGDGKGDSAEVSSLTSPADTDGDGKVDAIESAIRDVEGDCIPDELDAADTFSDLPSASFPNACGTGRPAGGGGGEPTLCDSVTTYLGGTCAEALGTALAVCFDPVGCMRPETRPDESSRVVWENGAYIDQDPVTQVIRMYSSRGQLCAEGEVGASSETESVFTYRASGQSWTITVHEADDSVDLRCGDGTVIHVSAQANAAIASCQGTSYQLCDGVIPKACADDTGCSGGQVCCPAGDTGYCLPPESCAR